MGGGVPRWDTPKWKWLDRRGAKRFINRAWWPLDHLRDFFFWVMAIIPSVAIADLGVRGEAAIYFLSSFSTLTNPIAILLSTTLLWIINLILPALIGCFFVFKMKLFDDDE